MKKGESIYTDEHKEFLKDNVVGRSRKELMKLFNDRFNLSVSESVIHNLCTKYKLRNGNDTRFYKGMKPYIKLNAKANSGSFKEGNVPATYKPVGSEVITFDGYIKVKVGKPNKWKAKHRLIWEETNGVIPKGYIVIFLNNDRTDCRLENLRLIHRRELARLNQKFKTLTSDVKESAINLVRLQHSILQKTKKAPNTIK